MHRAKYYAIIKNIVQVYKMSWSVGRYNKLENWKLLLLLASKVRGYIPCKMELCAVDQSY
jgi:hypothetical protein